MQIFNVVMAGRSQFAQIRRCAADFVKNVQRKGKACFGEDGGQMQNRIGAAAESHVAGYGVAHGLFRNNLPGAQIAADKFQNLHTGFLGQTYPRGGNSGNGAVAG